MPRVVASRELLAPPEDVWGFLAEPNHLADWWPGIHAVRPDRRGLAPGARWQLVAGPPTRGGAGGVFGGAGPARAGPNPGGGARGRLPVGFLGGPTQSPPRPQAARRGENKGA